MKVCKKCKESKELIEFRKYTSPRNGVRSFCKKCEYEKRLNYYRAKEGKLNFIYDQQKKSSKKRGHKLPTYTKEEFIDRFIDDLDFERHYYSWVISNYSKDYAPSFDRKDDYKSYSFDNLQIMYWFENNNKRHSDVKNGVLNKQSKSVVGTNILTGDIIEFYSTMEAERNGFYHTAISACCSGKRNYHKGYTWKYKN